MSPGATSQIPAWFERKFDFTFPVEQYLNLCVRLRGTPARLEEIFRGVSRDVLLGKPGDKWSTQEHAGHLLDLESVWMARADDFLADRDTLTVADLSNRKTHEAIHKTKSVMDRAIAREQSLSRVLMTYIVTGLVFMLLPETFLGVWNLIKISNRGRPNPSLPPGFRHMAMRNCSVEWALLFSGLASIQFRSCGN